MSDPEILPAMVVPGRRWITCFDPSTGFHLGTFLADNEVEIQGKILRARNSQQNWKDTTFQQRRRVMRSLLKWLVDNQEACARVACRDTGKTRKSRSFVCYFAHRCAPLLVIDASLGEILVTCSKLEWLVKHGEDALRPETRHSNFMLFYKKSQVIYEPLGVVAAIVSWNYRMSHIFFLVRRLLSPS